MKKLLVVCLFSLGVFSSLKANNIAVSNVTLQNRNTISDYVSVAFNLSWETEVIQDKATEGKEKEVCEKILRTQKIVSFNNRGT
jgi:hypothetical protein